MAQAGSIRDDVVPEGSPALAADGVDPELLEIPAPARGRRLATLALMALAVVVALAMLASVRRDISYFFHPSVPTELGEAVALDPADLDPNSYVTVRGTPMASGTVAYGKVLGSGRYQAFPLAGQRTIFVQMPVESDDAARTLPRREFTGRLITFGEAGGRFATVRRYLEKRMGMPVSSESFLLLADEPPASYWSSLALAGLAGIFILINLLLFLRYFRPIQVRREARL